jgi:hypothetical protein
MALRLLLAVAAVCTAPAGLAFAPQAAGARERGASAGPGRLPLGASPHRPLDE